MAESFYLLKEEFTAATNQRSLSLACKSKNVALTACAAVAGAKILDHQRVIEDTQTIPSTTCTFSLEDGKFDFRPDFQAETLTTAEIIKRASDDQWLKDNPNHPITWMMLHADAMRRVVEAMRLKSPLIKIVNGSKNVYLAVDGDREKQSQLLEHAGFTKHQIKTMLENL